MLTFSDSGIFLNTRHHTFLLAQLVDELPILAELFHTCRLYFTTFSWFVPDKAVHLEVSCISHTHTNVKHNFAHMILQITEIKVKCIQSQRIPLNHRLFALFFTRAPRNALWKPMTSPFERDVISRHNFPQIKNSLCLIHGGHDLGYTKWDNLDEVARSQNTISREDRDV
jgi:hypothetical protein